MTVKTYEELGREADLAARAAATARQSVKDWGSPQAAGQAIVISIKGGDWNNGLLHLVPFLQQVLVDRLEEILPEAIRRMDQAADDAVAEMHRAFQDRGSAALVGGSRVPRSSIDTLGADVLERAAGEHAASVAQQPASAEGAAGGTAAPSGPGGPPAQTPPADGLGQVPLGHAEGQGAAPTGKPPAVDPISKPQQESLYWIRQNPRKKIANTADIGDLVARGLLQRDGAGYVVTTKGVDALAALEG